MTSEMSLRINMPFIKYVAEQEQKKVSNPTEPKRSIFERIDEGIGLNWLKRRWEKGKVPPSRSKPIHAHQIIDVEYEEIQK